MKLTAKQKEQLSRPRPFLFLAVLGVFGLPWVVLFWSGVQARQQQAQMAVEANTFFAQFPTYQRNAAARQFDQMAADLGFIPNDPSSLFFRVRPEAERAYQTIEETLSEFLRQQAAKVSGPLDSPPPVLSTYLNAHREAIAAAQSQILESEAPRWEMDFERMSELNYPFPGFVNVFNLQKLLLLAAIDHSHQGRQDEMLTALEASWRLNQAIAQRPDLVSQMLVSVVSEQQAGVLRHLENVPAIWQTRLTQQSQRPSVIAGLQFDAWLQYQISQRSLLRLIQRPGAMTDLEKLLATLSYWFSPAYGLELTAIDTTRTAHRALDQLTPLDICATPLPIAELILSQEKTAWWNSATAISPVVVAQRWRAAGDRALTLELTQKVLQAKQLSQSGQWPNQLPNLASEVCPEERWIYERTDDNTITLSLSAQRMPAPAVPFSYQSSGK
ncbi:hypothetical protein [Leptolyngbya sp. BC1307]|uniref:hypothetical protein n=1 Tax=Leptolyngbya sp. BC1307 TaxID=2029589 RepID=UPI000EFB8563|nr:hypothetical protein [Leptolyngbya sp. BC1307]